MQLLWLVPMARTATRHEALPVWLIRLSLSEEGSALTRRALPARRGQGIGKGPVHAMKAVLLHPVFIQ